MRAWFYLFIAASLYIGSYSAFAQDGPQVFSNFLDFMQRTIEQQQQLEAQKNSTDYKNQELQPGGLTRGQVIIVQQLLLQQGYDIGQPDGTVGPKTRAAVAKLQFKAGVPATGLPSQQLLEALLQGR